MDGHWHHFCIIWSSIEGRFWYYLDRHLISTGSKFQKGYEIPPGGSMILRQEQDSIGGDFDEAEAFVGRMACFALWTRSLCPGEVSGLASGKRVPRGAVLSLDDVNHDVWLCSAHYLCVSGALHVKARQNKPEKKTLVSHIIFVIAFILIKVCVYIVNIYTYIHTYIYIYIYIYKHRCSHTHAHTHNQNIVFVSFLWILHYCSLYNYGLL